MNASDSRLSPSATTGRLEGISIPDLLWTLCRPGNTGVLHIRSGGVAKKVYVLGGRIVFAASSDPNDRLGERLLRDGMVRLEQLEQAIARLPEGKRLGTLLVEAGHLSPENLVRGVLAQVKGIVLDLFLLEEGEYQFDEGPLPTEEVVTLNMKTGEILLHGIRRIRSFSRIRRSVGSPHSRYRLSSSWDGLIEGLGISDGERAMLERLGDDGTDIETLCRDVFLSNFEIYQALWAFKVLGVVEEVERLPHPQEGARYEGRLGRAGLGAVLVRLARGEDTGVLRVSRGTLERSFHLKEGRCVFATSNNIDDGLVAHLLRRGVISLHDREETAKRMLSNKRVGTILLQMGVISEADLRTMVREQLCEIVYDTFRWQDGDYFFTSGELPTIEEITLDSSLEDLVFAGVRRVTSWSTVLEGTGALDVRLTLTPDYLSILDRMTGIRAGDWEILSLLAEPKKVVDICRASNGGDFATCQTLWAFKLLGAAVEAPPEPVAVVEAEAQDELHADSMPPAADPDPEPIAPAEVSGEEAFEVTGPAESTPPPSVDATADGSVPPSEWSEPKGDRTFGPKWQPSPDQDGLDVAEIDGPPGELVNETWRLTSEFTPPPRPRADDGPDAEAIEKLFRQGDEVPDLPPPEPIPAPPAESVAAPPPPRFELAEPGTDLPPTFVPPRDQTGEETQLELAEPEPDRARSVEAAAPEPHPARAIEDDPDRTLVISRDEVEAVLQDLPQEASAETAEPAAVAELAAAAVPEPAAEQAAPPWDPPAELDGQIARFNARHKVVFRTIRSEVGAGAVNFVRSCRNALPDGLVAMFHHAEVRADGSFDTATLRKGVVDHRVDDAWTGFQRLLDHEVEMLRVHLGDQRSRMLVEEIEKI